MSEEMKRIRDILNERMTEYGEEKNIGEKDKIFLKTYKEIKKVLLKMIGEDFNGENNPMLNEYTRGFNTALDNLRRKVGNERKQEFPKGGR